jgi:hypothetical protein
VKGSTLCNNPRNHYPVTAELMRKWSKEVVDELATPEEPSSSIVAELSDWRAARSTQSKELKASKKETGSDTNKLLDQFLKI